MNRPLRLATKCLRFLCLGQLLFVLMGITFGLALSAQADLNAGLIGNWTFSGNANDSSGNALNGAVTSATPSTDRFGLANSDYHFNGNSWIEIADAPVLDSLTSWSVCAWIKPETLTSPYNERIVDKMGDDYSGVAGFSLIYDQNRHFEFNCGWGGGTQGVVVSVTQVESSQWYFLVGTYDGAVARLYVNGTLEASAPMSWTMTSTKAVQIGRFQGSTNPPYYTSTFFGDIDDVRIYNRALNDNEVGELNALQIVATGTAIGITSVSGTLTGTINPDSFNTTVSFAIGTGTNYGAQSESVILNNATGSATVGIPVTGLRPDTLYHFRCIAVTASGTCFGQDEIFTTPASNPDTIVDAVTGDPADGLPGERFSGFSIPIVNMAGHVAFAASFKSGVSKVTAYNKWGIWVVDTEGARQLIASTGSPAADVPNSVFSSLSDPVYNNYDEVAFIGTLKTGTAGVTRNNESGIWANLGGDLKLVVREGDLAADCPSGTVYSGFEQVFLSDVGLVFSARLRGSLEARINKSNNQGVWAVSTSGTVQKILRTGDQINLDNSTKIIRSVAIFSAHRSVSGQSRSVDSYNGNICYVVGLTDGTYAVVHTVMP